MSEDTKKFMELDYYINSLLENLKDVGPGWEQAIENLQELKSDVQDQLQQSV